MKEYTLWEKPRLARLTVRVGKESESYMLPIPEAAWLARMLSSIFTDDARTLFRVGTKATFARYEKGRVQIELKPLPGDPDDS